MSDCKKNGGNNFHAKWAQNECRQSMKNIFVSKAKKKDKFLRSQLLRSAQNIEGFRRLEALNGFRKRFPTAEESVDRLFFS